VATQSAKNTNARAMAARAVAAVVRYWRIIAHLFLRERLE
jgi:hypothetical protein